MSKYVKSKREPRPGKANAGGLKGRSGPPGNLHAAKHGLQSWLQRRALPLNKQHVAVMAVRYRDNLLACKGGPDGATEVEQALIENATKAFGAGLLVLEEAKAQGMTRRLDSTWDLSPGFSRLVGFLNSERMSLVALGLGRREKEVPDLNTLLLQAQDKTP